MAELLFAYLRISFFASVMILAVVLVRLLMRKAPRNITCLLWLLVALRLLLPFELKSPISLQPRPITKPVHITDLSPQPVSPTPEFTPEIPSNPVPEVQKPVMEAQPNTSFNIDPETVMTIIWAAGSVGLLIYAAVSLAVLRHRVWDAIPCPDGVWESDRIGDAFLLGYWKPRIYLPAFLPHRDRELIVAHERSHQSRGDQWWKLLGLVCLSIHWFNPLVWLGFWLMCQDIEAACDEKVIDKLDLEQRKDYSMALLNSSKRMSGLLSYPVAFGEINLKHRIKNVLSYRKPDLWVTLGAVAVAAVIAVCFMTNPETREPDTIQAPPVTDIQPDPTVPPTEAVTEPTATATEPTTQAQPTIEATEPTTPPTEPKPTEPKTTAPTEPKPTEPKTTEPEHTEPTPTEPPVTKPQGPTVLGKGNWCGRTTWKITSDGILTLSGNRHIDGSSSQWYSWTDYTDQITKIVINEGITTIPTHAFYGMSRVTEVSLPNTIEKIESYAFWDCSSLQSVTIPPKVKELGNGAFFYCTSLRAVNFAPGCSLETIGGCAFSETALVEFHAPASLKSIESSAFAGCTSLKVLDLWNCNASVHKNAFYECSAIRQVLLGKGSSLSQYAYPLWYQVETAKLYSDFYEIFSNRPLLQSVEIGGRVKEIPFGAFTDCTSLTGVTITAPITLVGQGAFNNCSSLTELTLPNTVTEIDCSALAGTSIKSFTVPASVTKIRWGAFMDSAMEQITFTGDAPKYIAETAFRGVTATVYYRADNPTWTQDKLQNYEGNLTWVPM